MDSGSGSSAVYGGSVRIAPNDGASIINLGRSTRYDLSSGSTYVNASIRSPGVRAGSVDGFTSVRGPDANDASCPPVVAKVELAGSMDQVVAVTAQHSESSSVHRLRGDDEVPPPIDRAP